jgi:hypothetical protein
MKEVKIDTAILVEKRHAFSPSTQDRRTDRVARREKARLFSLYARPQDKPCGT